jgi:hypothetical protein
MRKDRQRIRHPRRPREIFTLVREIKQYARLTGVGKSENSPIQVAVSGKGYWPLPWYLRDRRAVGWYADLPSAIGPLIVITDDLEAALLHRLYEETPRGERRMYLPLLDEDAHVWLRPGVKMLAVVRKDVWDRYSSSPCIGW